MGINSAEWIIQQIYICILIESTSELDTLLLTTAEVDTSFAYDCAITKWKHLKILY